MNKPIDKAEQKRLNEAKSMEHYAKSEKERASRSKHNLNRRLVSVIRETFAQWQGTFVHFR